jgi:hypothetical protein
MTLPFALPDWLPWWVPVVVLIPVLLYFAVFLMVPFSVFGLKGRLDLIDARLDEIQGEIRTLSLRLPESARHGEAPPVPPATAPPHRPRRAHDEDESLEDVEDIRETPGRRSRGPRDRSEPRLDWPR